MSKFLFLWAFIFINYSNDDLIVGLEETVPIGTQRDLKNVVQTEQLNSDQLQPEDVKQAIFKAQSLKMLQLELKVQLLDSAHKLAPLQRQKFLKQQKNTQAFRNEIAHRMVERSIKESNLPKEINDSIDSMEALNVNARKVYEQLPTAVEREEFKANWKSSLIDPGARTSFGSLIAMAQLYGAQNELVKSISDSMQKYRDSFKLNHSEYSDSVPANERSDMLYRVLKSSKMIFNRALQNKLNKIDLMENQLTNSALDPTLRKLAVRKIELEKDILMSLMRKEGLKLAEVDEDLSLEDFEKVISEWFEKHALQPEILVWPFEERGEVVANMSLPERPYCEVRTVSSHGIRSPVEARLIQKSSHRLMLMSAQHWIVFEGSLKLEEIPTIQLAVGQLLAISNAPHEMRVTIQNTSAKKSYVNICNLR